MPSGGRRATRAPIALVAGCAVRPECADDEVTLPRLTSAPSAAVRRSLPGAV